MRWLLWTLVGCGEFAVSPEVLPPAGNVVFDGNSLVATSGQTAAATWPDLVVAALSPRPTVHNVAWSGQTTAEILKDVEIEVDPLYREGRANVYVVWEITNALYFGATAAEAYDQVVRLGAGRRSRGWKVLVLTPMPRGDAGTPGDFEARRRVVIYRMRRNWRAFADGLVDVAADPVLGSPESLGVRSIFYDRVHLGPAGSARVANLVGPRVTELLGH